MCNLADYTCKLLNFRFTTPILITMLDTVEVTPFLQKFFPLSSNLADYTCNPVDYTCKVLNFRFTAPILWF